MYMDEINADLESIGISATELEITREVGGLPRIYVRGFYNSEHACREDEKLERLLRKLYWYHEYQSNHYAIPMSKEYYQQLVAEIAEFL